ncbi:MAG: hypothetical protein HDT48_03185 [Ruminococcaceae bacterium]|nr:hypothetical protein [Oscillospiraceae bacterium]
MMSYFTEMYCDKCGHFWNIRNPNDSNKAICGVCKNNLKIIPDEYFNELNVNDVKKIRYINDEMKQKLINDLVLTSPNFDQYLFDHKDEIKGQQDRKYRAAMEHGKAVMEGKDKGKSYGVACPYCKATNVRKIGIVSRSVSAGIFGLGSKKIGKQWHCNNCGSDF